MIIIPVKLQSWMSSTTFRLASQSFTSSDLAIRQSMASLLSLSSSIDLKSPPVHQCLAKTSSLSCAPLRPAPRSAQMAHLASSQPYNKHVSWLESTPIRTPLPTTPSIIALRISSGQNKWMNTVDSLKGRWLTVTRSTHTHTHGFASVGLGLHSSRFLFGNQRKGTIRSITLFSQVRDLTGLQHCYIIILGYLS
jgi:hypothetical protein